MPSKTRVTRPKNVATPTLPISAEDFSSIDFGTLQQVTKVDAPEKAGWRVEYRYYTKKSGEKSTYFNYRAKRSHVTATGKRTTAYLKGGKFDG